MSVPLEIRSPAGGGSLSPEQKRFNTLLRQLEKARASLQAWQEALPAFHQSRQGLLGPLVAELRQAQRAWVLALDAAAHRGWSRREHEDRSEMLAEMAGALLGADAQDEELQALFERHAGMSREEVEREGLDAFKELAQAMTGLDLGKDDIASEQDVFDRLDEHLRRQDEAQAARQERTAARRKSAAQQRREEEGQRATQSIREVYRKLASALHPDRERDPAQRETKTRLMAQVNEAFDRKDLLTLLELQLRIEQVDPEHLARADTTRLKHYNKVLSEQLAELRNEVVQLEFGLRMDLRLPPFEPLDPARLGRLLQAEVAQIRAALATLQRETKLFADGAATRRWLKAQRRQRDEDFFPPSRE